MCVCVPVHASPPPAGSRHSGALGVGDGGLRAVYEAPVARLSHVHTAQENHGEGVFHKTCRKRVCVCLFLIGVAFLTPYNEYSFKHVVIG